MSSASASPILDPQWAQIFEHLVALVVRVPGGSGPLPNAVASTSAAQPGAAAGGGGGGEAQKIAKRAAWLNAHVFAANPIDEDAVAAMVGMGIARAFELLKAPRARSSLRSGLRSLCGCRSLGYGRHRANLAERSGHGPGSRRRCGGPAPPPLRTSDATSAHVARQGRADVPHTHASCRGPHPQASGRPPPEIQEARQRRAKRLAAAGISAGPQGSPAEHGARP